MSRSKAIHLVRQETPAGPHRMVAGHGGQDMVQPAFERRGAGILPQDVDEIENQGADIRVAQNGRRFRHGQGAGPEAFHHEAEIRQSLGMFEHQGPRRHGRVRPRRG